MNLSGHKLLTSTGFTEDQHCGIRGRHDGNLLAHLPHWRTAADDLSNRSRLFLAEIGVLSFKFPSNVELLFELSPGLVHLLDRPAGCSEHEVDDHFQLLDGLVLALDAYKLIEITPDRQAQLVRDLLHHLADILTRPEKLGEILLKHGKITVHQLEELIKEQETSGKPLGELILSKGLMSRSELLTALDWQHKADKVIIDSLTELINKPKKD